CLSRSITIKLLLARSIAGIAPGIRDHHSRIVAALVVDCSRHLMPAQGALSVSLTDGVSWHGKTANPASASRSAVARFASDGGDGLLWPSGRCVMGGSGDGRVAWC